MGNIKPKIYHFLTQGKCDGAKVFLIVSSYVCGFFLLVQGNTFEIQPHILMSKITHELIWGLAFITYAVLGTLNSFQIFTGKYLTLIESIIGFLIWTTAAVCIFMSTGQSPALAAPHIVGAGMSWWILIRTGLEHV